MKRALLLLGLVGAVLLSTAPVLADGDFYVVAGGGAALGTKIAGLPQAIDKPGFYYLTGNLSCPSGNGITINVDDVTIDLMGFSLSGNTSSDGITGSRVNAEIRNGSLSGWNHAIYLIGTRNRVINLRVANNIYGIYLTTGSLVRSCLALDNSNTGIDARSSTISNNSLINYLGGTTGIKGDGIISGNLVRGTHAYGIYCVESANIIGNVVESMNGQVGIHVSDVSYSSSLLDQNNVFGPGTHYEGGNSATVWAGKSAENPWGSNAGHP